MLYIKILFASLVAVLVSSCAVPAQKVMSYPTYFSNTEAVRLKYCLALSDTVRAMAEMKASGKSQAEVLLYYQTGKLDKRLIAAFAEKVFSENSSQIWDYTVHAMGECASEVAHVTSPTQVQTAKFCMHKQLIAQASQQNGLNGKAINDVYVYLESEGPNSKNDIEEAISVGYSWKGSRLGMFERIGEQCIDRYASR